MKSFKKLSRELLDTLQKAHWQALRNQNSAYYIFYNKYTDSFLIEDFNIAEVFDGVYCLHIFDYTYRSEPIKNISLAQADFKFEQLHSITADIISNKMFFIYKKEME